MIHMIANLNSFNFNAMKINALHFTCMSARLLCYRISIALMQNCIIFLSLSLYGCVFCTTVVFRAYEVKMTPGQIALFVIVILSS